ncbi:MAG: M56 family metallopeptidase [Oscillospiraceae bacterium]|nr:M56 family metallopeptidase [Oscillospiraceae bacterium]
MSLSGGVLILAVTVLRALTLNRLPKKTFLALWAVAVLRLLIPLSIPSVFSVYSLLARTPAVADTPVAGWIPSAPPAAPASTLAPSAVNSPAAGAASAHLPEIPPWAALWLIGALLCGTFFLLAYLRAWREFQTSLPLHNEFLNQWLEAHPLRRRISIRQSDRISAPLTYGLFHPVILLPKNTDWTDLLRLNYVLQHEYTHIRRWDTVWKCLLTLALCVHWFNPLVWVMYLLANRDLELACDEAVVRSFGASSRADYAHTLISMEEQKGMLPFCSHFSRQALEERIVAIMKLKKTTFVSLLLAAALVLGTAAAFATSAKPEPEKDMTPSQAPVSFEADPYRPFMEGDAKVLLSLQIEGYKDMTVADYQEKLWLMADDLETREMIDRFSLYETDDQLSLVPELKDEFEPFRDYFFNVFEPLTAEKWQQRQFSGYQLSEPFGARRALVEYIYTLELLDRDTLTVGEYEEIHQAADQGFLTLLDGCTEEQLLTQERMTALLDGKIAALTEKLSTDQLRVSLAGYSVQPLSDDPDAELHATSSKESSDQWDRVLAPYVSFGLTYKFDDPDLDGNGLTMWYQGKEVRGIMDEHEGWITEHSGNSSYSPDAVELYAVYTDGRLTGLRFATEEEQAEWTRIRNGNTNSLGAAGPLQAPQEEQREFPQATRADYDSILSLRTAGYETLSLEEFNQRLLDWNEAHSDAADRIMCDVLWDDYGVELTTDERTFVSHTCLLSNQENAKLVQSLHTGQAEEDPHISANLPEFQRVIAGRRVAWCELYYDISYHISGKTAVTVAERDNYVAAMLASIQEFWWETDMDQLLSMTEDEVVDLFNTWAVQLSATRVNPITGETGETRGVVINPVTADDIHFEAVIDR